jgi:hypothetical protein
LPSVYLAGAITGLSFRGATSWREYVKKALEPSIKTWSPLRGKEYLAGIDNLSGTFEEYGKLSCLSTSKGILTRDSFDATHCDVLFVNLLGTTEKSAGTIMEIAWSWLSRIPIVCAMEKADNPHEHGMITEAIGYRVTSLDEAIHVTRAILL